MNATRRALLILLSVATGGLFVYSAYTKAFPIYTFEATMVEYLHFPWLLSAIAARLFVGLEAGMGLLIAANIYGMRKWVLRCAFWLLMVFNVYLIYLWIAFGNNVNCGCFGDAVWMNPSTSLIKNVWILGAIGVLLKYNKGINGLWPGIAIGSISLTMLIVPFIVFPITLETTSTLDLTPMYVGGKTPTPSVELRKGKYVVAFVSPSCSHCRNAALKMHQMKEKYPDLPFFMIIGGTTSDLTDFWKASHAQDLPYVRMDKDLFMKYTGGVFPVILWVNNGNVETKVSYRDMTAQAINNWIKK